MSKYAEKIVNEIAEVAGMLATIIVIIGSLAFIIGVTFLGITMEKKMETNLYKECVLDGGRPELCLMAITDKGK